MFFCDWLASPHRPLDDVLELRQAEPLARPPESRLNELDGANLIPLHELLEATDADITQTSGLGTCQKNRLQKLTLRLVLAMTSIRVVCHVIPALALNLQWKPCNA